jgi:spermidine synthase
LWLVLVVSAAIGLPFMLLSASSPLLQLWLARGEQRSNTNIHRLYAVTNLANLVGLVMYIVVLEPLLGLRAQAYVLASASGLALVLSVYVAYGSRVELTSPPPIAAGTVGSVDAKPQHWLIWSFLASFVLFAVTTYLATDLAAFPLLFVLPLGVFLIGFALGYSGWAERHRRALSRFGFIAPLCALASMMEHGKAQYAFSFAFLMPLLASACLVTALASKLADARPSAQRLPQYYAAIGAGGVLAGVCSVWLVPWMSAAFASNRHAHALITDAPHTSATLSVLTLMAVPECPIALVAGMAALASDGFRRVMLVCVVASLLFGGLLKPLPAASVFQTRDFYGFVRVDHDPETDLLSLIHGSTLHGMQRRADPQPQAASYYHPYSPVGQLFEARNPKRVLVVGLGIGTLAAYASHGDRYDFLELNPTVANVAQHSGYFTYLQAARERGAEVDVQIGDGRMLIRDMPETARYELIVLDAFSSDAIPVHLLTREALALISKHLVDDGVIAVHVSNNFFDLVPVTAAAARDLDLRWALQDRAQPGVRLHPLERASVWVMVTRSRDAEASWGLDTASWQHALLEHNVRAWTDDWANPLGSLRWVSRLRR